MVLSSENKNGKIQYTWYFLPKVETKNCDVMIDGKNIFDQPIKNDLRTYDNIRKIIPGQGGYYTTGCLLDYAYVMVFRKQYS